MSEKQRNKGRETISDNQPPGLTQFSTMCGMAKEYHLLSRIVKMAMTVKAHFTN